MKKTQLKDSIRGFLTWFCIFYLLFWGFSLWQGDKDKSTTPQDVEISLLSKSLIKGHLVTFLVKNNTEENLTWESLCQNKESLKVDAILGRNQKLALEIPECDISHTPNEEILAKSSTTIKFHYLNTQLFEKTGEYQATFNLKDSKGEIKTVETPIFEVQEPGIFRKLFRSVVSKPLFNTLIWIIEKLPNHSLGLGIILLTILVRIILFLPNQKAMASQRKLQKLQPKIQALKKKYGKNQQQMALKTMELYKTHQINPMSSCLPMLLQMPFLLGIYLILQNGLSPHLNYLLYSFNEHFDISMVQTWFMGLNLEIPNIYVLPFLVGGAQFLAIKLSMAQIKKRNKGKKIKPVEKQEGLAGQMEDMQKMMLYIMPVMIGVFTATFPAAVGIYWLTSTVFGVGQQYLVNWTLDKPQVTRKV